MNETKFAVIETALGAFGVAWSDAGIARTWMHEGTLEATRAQVRRACPSAAEARAPHEIAETMAGVAALLRGESIDLGAAELDMGDVTELDRRVYELVRLIAPGSTSTYGEIGKQLGDDPRLAIDVGVAMARNRFAPIVPCHRVVAAGGKLGGYSAPGGESTKRRLLEIEHAPIVAEQERQLDLFG